MKIYQKSALPALLFTLFLFAGYTSADAQPPTARIVEKTLKQFWDRPGKDTGEPSVCTMNSVKFGQSYRATVQEVQVGGLPAGSTVTPVIYDFTVRDYYKDQTHAVRRVREGKAYKDRFGEWVVTNESARGADVTTTEPARH